MARTTPTKAPDFELKRLDPPPSLTGDQKGLQRNLDAICKQADGEWYRIGRFEGAGAGANRASTLRKRQKNNELEKKLEFRGVMLDEPEEGYRSELYARWTGAPGQAGHRDPELRALEGGKEEDEEGEAPPRRGPGRPPGSRNRASAPE